MSSAVYSSSHFLRACVAVALVLLLFVFLLSSPILQPPNQPGGLLRPLSDPSSLLLDSDNKRRVDSNRNSSAATAAASSPKNSNFSSSSSCKPPDLCALLPCVPPRMQTPVPQYTRRVKAVRPRIAVLSMYATPTGADLRLQGRGGAAGKVMVNRRLQQSHFYNCINYCQRHGYDFILEDSSAVEAARGHAAWGKIRSLQKWLPRYEFVAWVDTDALFMNWTAKLEDMVEELDREPQPLRSVIDQSVLNKSELDLFIAEDFQNIIAGFFLIRNSTWSLDFLDRVYRVTNEEANLFFWEQSSVDYLIGYSLLRHKKDISRRGHARDPKLAAADRRHVYIQPHNFWNSYPPALAARVFNQGSEKRWVYKRGNGLLHSVACTFFLQCLPWFEFYARQAICDYGGNDAPLLQQQQQQQVDGGGGGGEVMPPPSRYLPPPAAGESDEATFPPSVFVAAKGGGRRRRR